MSDTIFYLTPPPNLTGVLHIGHILNLYIQRYITLYKKIFFLQDYYNILGFDHASLYAEIIAKKQNTNSDIIEVIKQNAIKFQQEILLQLKKYKYHYNNKDIVYTQSDIAHEIVTKTYSILKKKRILHKGYKVIYFDTKNMTAISDIEVTTKICMTTLYYIVYRLHNNNNDYIVICTTRPETIESDVAIICHPRDNRYSKYIGQYVINPLTDKKIKIYTHIYAIQEFGSGAVKITPHFDKKDEIICKELNIPISTNIIFDTNTLTFNSMSIFHNKTIEQARHTAIEILKQKGLYIKEEKTQSKQYISLRTNEEVLQISSQQTFIDLSYLEVISKTKIQDINIIGCVGHKELNMFMSNIDMWCISRNNIYGHKIENFVLDTWYASSLWPIICEKTINKQINTCVIITGYDIMFFWIYKMFYMSQIHNENKIHKIIVHGLMCDEHGNKISKTKNNDKTITFDTNEQYEINALGIMLHSILQKRIRYDDTKFILAKKIINKITHIGTFMLTQQIAPSAFSICSDSYLTQMVIYEIMNIVSEDESQAINNISHIYYILKNIISNVIVENYKHKKNIYYQKTLYTTFGLFLKLMHCICAYTPQKIYKQLYLDDIESFVCLTTLKKYTLHKHINIIVSIIKFNIDNTKQKTFFIENKNVNTYIDEFIYDMFTEKIKHTHIIELDNIRIYFNINENKTKISKKIINTLINYVSI